MDVTPETLGLHQSEAGAAGGPRHSVIESSCEHFAQHPFESKQIASSPSYAGGFPDGHNPRPDLPYDQATHVGFYEASTCRAVTLVTAENSDHWSQRQPGRTLNISSLQDKGKELHVPENGHPHNYG